MTATWAVHKSVAAAVCAGLLVAACGNGIFSSQPSSDAAQPGPGPDPTTLAPRVGSVQVVSMANRNVCLQPRPGEQAQAGAVVGVAACTGDTADSWRLLGDGTLSFANSLCLQGQHGEGVILALCSSKDPSQQWAWVNGRLEGQDGQVIAVSGNALPASADFQAVALAPSVATDAASQQWQVGLASSGASGDANVVITGFPIRLANVPGACLTGRGTHVGLTACNGSASQAWILNEAGGLQLGAYCLAATTPGTISQGTPAQFALCRSNDLGQSWRVAAGYVTLQKLFLAPTTTPPPLAGFTPTALTTSDVQWQLGGP